MADFVFDSGLRYDSEVRPRLRQRLLLFLTLVLIVAVLQAAWMTWRRISGGNFSEGALALLLARVSVLAAGVLLLWRGTTLSLARLRLIESVVLVASVVSHTGSVYIALSAGNVVSQISPVPTVGTQAMPWFLAFGQGVTFSEVAALAMMAATCTFPLALVLSAYGGLIPTTARRSAYLVALVFADAIVATAGAALTRPALSWTFLHIAGLEIIGLAPFAALCIAAAHRFDSLSRQLFQARRLGQYTLGRKLGAGGMGDVYLARHQFLRRPCAVKLIRPDIGLDPSHLVRFEREVQAMAGLSHPNAVEIFDYGRTDDGTFYYVMEYVPGCDLSELVRRHGPLPPGRVVYLLRQACDALREAHAVGLIHRDIKPSNLLLCTLGQRADVVKLLDFGLVLRVNGAPTDKPSAELPVETAQSAQPEDAPRDALALQVTQAGSLLGTPAFMSPEQILANRPLDARSDIYSLGCVAYFLLTGRPPFLTQTAMEVLAAHLAEPVTPPTAARPDLPADLEAVVLRCLEKDPQRRFLDVATLTSALVRCACASSWDGSYAAAWWSEHPAGTDEKQASESEPLSETIQAPTQAVGN